MRAGCVRRRAEVAHQLSHTPQVDSIFNVPAGKHSLRWKDTQKIADDNEAKISLYQRLARSLPGNSPPQQNLFYLYHDIYGSAVPDLPALLPRFGCTGTTRQPKNAAAMPC